jgi:hypothetical protein
MKLWDYDSGMLLPNLPSMVTFPKLQDFYADWKKDLVSKGVEFRLSTEVTEIVSRKGNRVVLRTRPFDPSMNDRSGEFAPQVINDCRGGYSGPTSEPETFDKMVMCVLADDALKILGRSATWMERFVLGGAAFFDDITITHSDSKYFDKIYEPHFNKDLAAEPRTKDEEQHLAFAKGTIERNSDGEPSGYRPMYFTHSYEESPQSIEMSFDCTNYQHQFRMDHNRETPPIPYDRHVFQSIFLDKRNKDLWTLDQIDKDQVIESKWWHQLGHRWQHYVRVVPNMMWINGKNNTFFAGSWTLVVSLKPADYGPSLTRPRTCTRWLAWPVLLQGIDLELIMRPLMTLPRTCSRNILCCLTGSGIDVGKINRLELYRRSGCV